MNQKFKKILAALLSTAVMLSTELPVALSVSAAEPETDLESETVSEEVQENDSEEAEGEIFVPKKIDPLTLDMLDDDEQITGIVEYYNYLRENGDEDVPEGNNAANFASQLPDEADNSTNENKIYMPSVRSQGSIGSCVAWSTVYYQYTYMMNKARGVATTSKNTYSPTFVYNLINSGGDNGSLSYKSYEFLKKQGAVTISDVGIKTAGGVNSNYLNWNATGNVWANALDNRLTSHVYFTARNSQTQSFSRYVLPVSSGTPITSPDSSELNTIKAALARGEILSFGSSIGDWQMTKIKSSTEEGVDNRFVNQNVAYCWSSPYANHQMTIVGYNDNIWTDINGNDKVDSGEMGAFKIVNSWGTGPWRTYDNYDNLVTIRDNSGYVWVAYDALNTKSSVAGAPTFYNRSCIFTEVSSISVTGKESDCSGVYLKYTLNTSNRSDSYLTVTAKDKTTNAVKSASIIPYGLSSISRYGSYAYNGTGTASDGTMAYDLSNVVSDITPEKLANYRWSVTARDSSNNSSSLIVKDIRIVDKKNGKEYVATNIDDTALNGDAKTYDVPLSDDELPELFAKINLVDGKTVPVGQKFTVDASATGGVAPYQYKYSYVSSDGKETVVKDYSTNTSAEFTISAAGSYKVKVTAKDAKNQVSEASTDLTVTSVSISSFMADKTTAKTNETVKFKAIPNTTAIPVTYSYSVSGNGTTQSLVTNSDNTASWKPEKEGQYTITAKLLYNNTAIATKTMSYTVEKGEVVTNNLVTIYYKGYSTPYIHYQVGSGTWTTVPGKAMTPSTEVTGYTHKYTIELGTETYTNVCFNNGSGNWDSNGGVNYKFEKGTYTYSNGTITPYKPIVVVLSAKAVSDSQYVPINQPVKITASAEGGTAPYQYRYTYIRNGSESVISDYSTNTSTSFTPALSGVYSVKVTIKDAKNATAEATVNVTAASVSIGTLTADKTTVKAGETVKFKATSTYESIPVSYRYTITGNNETKVLTTNSDNTASWKPTKEGSYTVKAELLYKNTSVANKSMSYTVEKGEEVTDNIVTIYYKGYNNPFIHYQVGSGTWTNAPGVSMNSSNKVSGFTHEYTINLGTATYANVCFNDGNNSWDNNGGANYKFNKGAYTFTGGKITPYVVVNVDIKSFTANKTTVKTGETVKFTATPTDNSVTLSYRYSVSGNDISQTLTTNSDNTANWTPTKEGTYTVKAELIYNSKTVASKTMTYTVEKGENVTLNQVTIYYKGYTTPYIHYQVGNGTWTAVPGVAMTATNELTGFTHKYTIDLGSESYTNVCFNDGKGNWDSRGGANYRFTKGSYSFSDGVISILTSKSILIVDPLVSTPTISAETIKLGGKVTAKCTAKGGVGTYKYAFYYKKANSTKWTTKQGFSTNNAVTIKPAAATTYEVCVKVKDESGTIQKKYFTVKVQTELKNTSTVSATSVKFGETFKVRASATGGSKEYTYAVFYKKHASTKWTTKQDYRTNKVVTIKPGATGEYDVCVKVKDSDGKIVKQYFTVNVTK